MSPELIYDTASLYANHNSRASHGTAQNGPLLTYHFNRSPSCRSRGMRRHPL
jgi:hypothetical protein